MAHRSEARCVMVGVDGSVNSLAALRHAAMAATRRGAVLEVVHVVTAGELAGRPLRVVLPIARNRLQHTVETVLGKGSPLEVRQRVIGGEPGDVLAVLAEYAELLVVGARSTPKHGRRLGGTVTTVLTTSPCEVEIWTATHGPRRQRDAG